MTPNCQNEVTMEGLKKWLELRLIIEKMLAILEGDGCSKPFIPLFARMRSHWARTEDNPRAKENDQWHLN